MISGQNLPKPGGAKEIIDPYVKIELFGVNEDKMVFKTKTVSDNGKQIRDVEVGVVRRRMGWVWPWSGGLWGGCGHGQEDYGVGVAMVRRIMGWVWLGGGWYGYEG